jgi:hypothetical protein
MSPVPFANPSPQPVGGPAPLLAPTPLGQGMGGSPHAPLMAPMGGGSSQAPLIAPSPPPGFGASGSPFAPPPARRANRPSAPPVAVLDGLPPPVERAPMNKKLVFGIVGGLIALGIVLAVVMTLSGRDPEIAEPTAGETPPTQPTPTQPTPPVAPTEPSKPQGETLAAVQIMTEPVNATLTVNGNKVEGASPFIVRDVDARWPVRVRVEAPGYKTYDREETVQAPKSHLSVKLEPEGAVAPAKPEKPEPVEKPRPDRPREPRPDRPREPKKPPADGKKPTAADELLMPRF